VWKVTEKGASYLTTQLLNEQRLNELKLPLASLFQEIFTRYPQEMKKDARTSNPYFHELKARIQEVFAPALELTGFELHALGGMGLMRQSPYIIFLAPGHRTSKGIYPGYLMQIETTELNFGLGDADDNPPPVELTEAFAERSAELLSSFTEQNKDGYPQKRYTATALNDETLSRDFISCMKAYRQCLAELEDDVEQYLELNKRPRLADKSLPLPSNDQSQAIIDAFLVWYDSNPQFQRHPVPEYQKFSKEFFAKLSDDELADVFFQFAEDGGGIQTGGERKAPLLRESIEEDPKGFRAVILSIFDKDFDLETWWEQSNGFRGFGRGVRSIFLYRLFPDRFVPFNTKAVDAYRKLGLHPIRRPNGSFDYQLVLDAAKQLVALRPDKLDLGKADAMTHFLIGTPEGEKCYLDVMNLKITNDATISSSSGRRYWLLAAGRGGQIADDFLSTKTISVGFDFFEDLANYDDQDSIREKIVDRTGEDSSYKNVALALYEFAYEMKPGDIVFLKAGSRKILGVGVITSDYRYEPNPRVANHSHARDIQWIKTGSWQIRNDDRQLVQKTLTDITLYSRQVADLRNLLGLDESALDVPLVPAPTAQYEPYSKHDALRSIFMSESRFDELLGALQYNKNIVLQGPPGVGKTFVAKKLAYCLIGAKADKQIQTVQFHQSYSYEDFVQGIRPSDEGKFEVRDGIFYRFCKQAIADPENPYVFIVDEINRGNLSKIFGELMMLIEPDKRGREHAIPLTYSSEDDELFFVPANLHLIGTMNTADRSLTLVDYALRRRFYFLNLDPEFRSHRFREVLSDQGISEQMIDRIIRRVDELNERIVADDKDLGRGYRIGHSFFCPRSLNGSSENDWYRQVVKMSIEPLLHEYWFEDETKVSDAIDQLLS
jgi:MoxR-like ATPase